MPDKAMQPKAAPQCPECLLQFSVTFAEVEGLPEVRTNITMATRSQALAPLPVRCKCGWSGTAVFLEEA